MNSIELVEKFVSARKAENKEYGESVALGATKAMLSESIDLIDKVIKAFDHKDQQEIISSMRYVVMDCKIFVKYMEEKSNV